MAEVKILDFWISPFSGRVKLALKLKGIEFEIVEEDLANKSALLLETNPVHKKIPVLIHKGKPIAESLVILHYIDETWPSSYPLLPQDPHQRAVARFWGAFIDEKLYGPGAKSMMAKEEEAGEIAEDVRNSLKILEKELGEKDFFGGEGIGYVDIAAVFLVNMLRVGDEITGRLKFTEENYPALLNWLSRMLAIDAVKETIPPRDLHKTRMAARLQQLREASTS